MIEINVYCDGSTSNNGSVKATGGYGVYFPADETLNMSFPYIHEIPTNQKTELYAMMMAIRQCILYFKNNPIMFNENDEMNEEKCYMFSIYTDSMYTINCLDKWINGWIKKGWKKADGKPVLNTHILEPLYTLYTRFKDTKHMKIKLHHISAHTGKTDEHSMGNAMADKLSRNH